MSEGRLIYVIGQSGAGKNSIIAAARENLNKNRCLCFAHRYVTRPVISDDDDVAISEAAFAHYRQNGLFALDWQAHGICYGVGIYIDSRLRASGTVVVNGSRAYLPAALARYPGLTAVLITAPADVAHARLQRAPDLALAPAQLVTIDNSGPLEQAARTMIGVLLGGSV
jgi:ribose 1,5-bisphosphokinase